MTIKDIATTEEVKELEAVGRFSMPNHNPACTIKHPLLRYAFCQKGWGDILDTHFWHVMSEGQSKHSTLSIEGLKEWGVI